MINEKTNILPSLLAVSAVGFWSLSPVFVTLIGGKAGAAEIFLTAMTSALLVSFIIVLSQWGTTRKLIKNFNKESGLIKGFVNALVAGVCIGFWYFGFYQALQYGPKVEVTVIAFVWPLLSVIAMRIFAKNMAKPLNLKSWALIIVSFIGVSLIAFNNVGSSNDSESTWGVIWAFIAAVGSGLYLPFAVKASRSFSEIISPGPTTTFYSVTVSNISAFVVTSFLLFVSKYPLDFSSFDFSAVLWCVMIGLGVYLFAEVAWTWAFRMSSSLKLSSLPYFSPAVSVVLLAVFFDENISFNAAIGLALIVISNLFLHFDKKVK